jgi:acetylornithine deacetylase
VGEVIKGTGLTVEFKPLFTGIDPLETPAHAEIVQVVERLTHGPAGAVAFGTEAPYLQKLGIETVILGPGNIEQAHQPNEFIRLDRLQPMVEILTQLIQHFCVTPR